MSSTMGPNCQVARFTSAALYLCSDGCFSSSGWSAVGRGKELCSRVTSRGDIDAEVGWCTKAPGGWSFQFLKEEKVQFVVISQFLEVGSWQKWGMDSVGQSRELCFES